MKASQSSFSDISLIYCWVVVTFAAALVPPFNQSVLRVIFALPTILFIPGYVLIAALFPAKEDLDGLERIALSFGLSIAVVPLIGLGLNYTPWGIRLEPILISLFLFIIVMTTIATYRRSSLPPQARFTVPFRQLIHNARAVMFPNDSSRIDILLSMILLVSIITAIGATVFVIMVPKEGEHFTEFYVLGEGGKAEGYPRSIDIGKSYTVVIGIGNHEYREITYTIELHAMNMTYNPVTNTSSLNAMEELSQSEVTVPHNTTIELPWAFSVAQPGFNRIEFLLFNETIPGQAVRGIERINASYRDLHLWVDIVSP